MKKKVKSKNRYSDLRKCCIITKCLVLFMVLTVLQVRAEVKSQEVLLNVHLSHVTLVEVLKSIESQSNYTFLYSYDEVAKVNFPDVKFHEATIEQILTKCLEHTDLSFKIVDQTIIIRNEDKKTVPQPIKQRVISGRVTDLKNVPLPGVTVLVKGTTLGVTTDTTGSYKIVLPERAGIVLTFSFVGMQTKEIKISAQPVVNVVLEEDIARLNEVVVTGYMDIKRSSFTGNATTVTRDQLLKTNNKSVINALQVFDPSFRIKENNMWGSDPNALPEFNIRGESSIGMDKGLNVEDLKQRQRTDLKDNPNLPIFILDGFEVSVQKIYDMDINRIESMTILKDAAATALYGSRAANGVVVVTTVAPKAGQLTVTYNLSASVEFPDLSDYNLCNAAEKLEAERLSGLYKTESQAQQVLLDKKYNELQQKVLRGVNTDWLAQPLRNVFNHNHSLYVEGGVESVRYAVDLNYNSNKGTMQGSYRDRMGAGLSLDYRYKKLQLRNYVSYNSTRSEDSPYGMFSDYAKMQPYYELRDDDGKLIKKYGSQDNPVYKTTLASYYGKNIDNELLDNLNVNLYLLNSLQLKGQFSISKRDISNESFIDPKDAQFDNSELNMKGSLTRKLGKEYSWNVNAMLYFNREFNKHFINATVGINAKESKYESHEISFIGFQLGSLNTPGLAADQPDKTKASETSSRLFGLLASLNYTYNNVYLLDASYRLDGSSQFGADKRFAPFWSVGAGINIHNYNWLKDNTQVNTLRVRASYGSTGKVNFPSYTAVTTYSTDTESWYYTGAGSSLTYLGNPDLKWETTKTLDAGLEIGLLEDRIFLKASYYKKETEDLIDQVYIRTSSGFSTYRSNGGNVVNKGFEINIRGTVFRNTDWLVTVNANLASNKNEITKLGKASEEYNQKLNKNYDAQWPDYAKLQTKPLQQYQVGASTTALYAVQSAGIDPANGKEKFIKKGGKSTYTWCADDQIVVGDLNPDAQGAIGLNAGYKGIYVNASFMYQWGAQIYNSTLLEKVENADIRNSNVDKRVLSERWKKPGDLAPYYDLKENRKTKPTTRFVQDYNVLSFSSLSVGYDFRKDLIKKWKLASLGLRFNANDLCRWSTVKEERGTSYPYAKNFSFTLNVGF